MLLSISKVLVDWAHISSFVYHYSSLVIFKYRYFYTSVTFYTMYSYHCAVTATTANTALLVIIIIVVKTLKILIIILIILLLSPVWSPRLPHATLTLSPKNDELHCRSLNKQTNNPPQKSCLLNAKCTKPEKRPGHAADMKWSGRLQNMQHVCEIIRCKLGAEAGPCCYHRHLLFLNHDRRRDTGGAHEIHYFYCQEKPWKLCFCFWPLVKRSILVCRNTYLKITNNEMPPKTYRLLQNNILHSSDTGADFMIAIQQCAQIGNHWHSRTWSATCHCWQLNGKLNHTSVYTVGDTAHGDQGHKNWSVIVTHAELSVYDSANLLFQCNKPHHVAPSNKPQEKQRTTWNSF